MVDAVILSTEVGERVVATGQFSGTEVMRVADLSNMEVRVNVNENDIVNVKRGDRTRITIDAFPRQKFDGEVTEIASPARTSGPGPSRRSPAGCGSACLARIKPGSGWKQPTAPADALLICCLARWAWAEVRSGKQNKRSKPFWRRPTRS